MVHSSPMALDPEHQVAAGESDVEDQVAAGVSDPAEQPLCSDGASDQVRPEKGQESDSENKQSCGRCNSSMQPSKLFYDAWFLCFWLQLFMFSTRYFMSTDNFHLL